MNTAIEAHAFVSDGSEWTCGFHAAYALWYWLTKRTEWGRIAGIWLERTVGAVGIAAAALTRAKNL